MLYGNILKKFSDRHSVGLNLNGVFKWARNTYSGSHPLYQKVNDQDFKASLQYQFRLPSFQLTLNAGSQFQWRDIAGITYRNTSPALKANARYALNGKNVIQFQAEYRSSALPYILLDNHLSQDNELFYTIGNPDMKNKKRYTLLLSYTWMPINSLMAYASIEHKHSNGVVNPVFTLMDDETAILQSYIFNGRSRETDFFANVIYRLGNWNISGNVQAFYIDTKGYYRNSKLSWLGGLSLYGYAGQFSFNASYTFPMSYEYDYGMKYKRSGRYQVTAGWGNGSWNINVAFFNPFSRRWKDTTKEFATPIYSYKTDTYGEDAHSRVRLRVVYTFGYGKEVSHSNERKPE